MNKGLDVAEDSTSHIPCLRTNGFAFICRYYNKNNPGKNLTRAEAEALSAAGLTIVAIWENGFPTKASYFTKAKGVSDATAALQMAADVMGQPTGTAIYFAVDYDASADDVSGRITRYFAAVKEVFELAVPRYEVGVYGSGAVCKALLNAGLATFAWLSQSTSFRGTKTFKDFSIKQGAGITICGMDADTDAAPNVEETGGFTL